MFPWTGSSVAKIVPWKKNWPPWLLTVSSWWAGLWLSCDWAVTEPWSYWRCRDWAVTSPWLSCDLAVTELWPLQAVTELWSLGPGAVTSVVTVSSPWTNDHLPRTRLEKPRKWHICKPGVVSACWQITLSDFHCFANFCEEWTCRMQVISVMCRFKMYVYSVMSIIIS